MSGDGRSPEDVLEWVLERWGDRVAELHYEAHELDVMRGELGAVLANTADAGTALRVAKHLGETGHSDAEEALVRLYEERMAGNGE